LRSAKVTDIAKKLSPSIVSWQDLPENIKKYDYAMVRNWPKTFRAAGLEIYRLGEADAEATKRKNP
jgi:hypothetical protein